MQTRVLGMVLGGLAAVGAATIIALVAMPGTEPDADSFQETARRWQRIQGSDRASQGGIGPDLSAPAKSKVENELRRRIVDRELPGIQALASEPRIAAAVHNANTHSKRSQAEILTFDRTWRSTQGTTDPLFAPFLRNPTAEFLRKMIRDNPTWTEVFLMDDRGCIVASSHKTSDYWQGDEAKWTESYRGGKGGVHVGEIEFDESSQEYVIQFSVSIPGPRFSIGALTVSVSVAR